MDRSEELVQSARASFGLIVHRRGTWLPVQVGQLTPPMTV
jgi:hypothetical protein